MGNLRTFSRAISAQGEEGSKGILFAEQPDSEAFCEVFRRYGNPVLCFIHSLLGDRARAEDLMQETFVRAYYNLGSKRPQTKFSTWLFGIAYNVFREAVKEKYRRRREVALEEPASDRLRDKHLLQDERILAGEVQQAIQSALSGLQADHRVAFSLKVLHEMRYEEISRITGSSIGKLKTDLHRARLEMRKRLTPYLGVPASGLRGK